MRNILLILTFALLAINVFGQKYLQLEKLNDAETRKYFPGDEITFRLNNGQWYTRVIEDVSYEQKLVLFANGHVAVDSIVAFRSFKSARWSKSLGNQFLNFAAVWVVYSLIDQAVSNDGFDPGVVLIVPATSAATGFLIKKLFKHRTFRIKRNKDGEVKKWRLRAMDLTVK
ncbi:MAG: hypothetical protein K9J37_16225 [Saprospiraceae bacterium]|nr:hypothetical protein [Saprospiraceae bacterium]MCF8251461.1 hypothetical protein [Saprospiraceae bacterium]MCF8282229.1 hypothetical protein [Bacteroidales bacterium]MCF8313055.1 hypothetical protein [Saprospiraceae bacterium]MCF8441503.1 hypothetical protein [Saprospiraceae bacterium]